MESIHLEKKNVTVKFLRKWWQRDLQWSYTVNQDDKTSGDDLDTSENNEIGLFSKVILLYPALRYSYTSQQQYAVYDLTSADVLMPRYIHMMIVHK